MTIDQLVTFRGQIESFLRLIKEPEKNMNSKVASIREKAAKELSSVLPILRTLTLLYIKKFCNESAIASNNAFLSSLRVDILWKVREHVDVPLPKKYAKILKTTKK